MPDLVAYMSEQQLRFTPATAGDESSYMALFRALTQCDKGIEREGASKEVSWKAAISKAYDRPPGVIAAARINPRLS